MSVRTLADIARLAGVSRTTASYVINGRAEAHRISAATVARVQAVVDEHEFRIDARAAALRSGRTRIVGLIVPDLENASYARLAKHIEHGLRATGHQLVIGDSDDDPATERELVSALRARHCDALIVASCLDPTDDLYADMVANGTPVIGLDRPLDDTRLRSVTSANASAAQALTVEICGAPRADLLWLDAVPDLSITRSRRRGFTHAAQTAGMAFRIRSGKRYDRTTGAALMHDYLADHPPPDALLTAAYPLLDGALDVLLGTDMTVDAPRLPALATFGDHRLLDFLPTTVHAMAQQHEHVAAQTLRRLWAGLAGDYSPGRDRIDRVLRSRNPRLKSQNDQR